MRTHVGTLHGIRVVFYLEPQPSYSLFKGDTNAIICSGATADNIAESNIGFVIRRCAIVGNPITFPQLEDIVHLIRAHSNMIS